jgi:hypothetical protein
MAPLKARVRSEQLRPASGVKDSELESAPIPGE